MITFLITLVVSVVVMALAEYVIHRYTMHMRFFPKGTLDFVFEDHHIDHHKFNDYSKNIDLPIYFHLLLSAPIIIALFFLSYWALFAWLLVIAHHSIFWTKLHRSVHDLESNWTESLPFYKSMRQHHLSHHDHPNKNFGVVYPVTDMVFGTKV